LGRRRARGRPRPGRGADEGHRARRRRVRRDAGERLHRVRDLGLALLLPAERLRRGRARIRGLRGALGADRRCLRGRGRPVRPRGASDRDRLRLRHGEEDARGHRPPSRLRDQPRPEPLRAPAPRPRGVRARVRRPDLPRPRQGLEAAARRPPLDPRLAPELRRGGARLGLRLAGARRRRLRGARPHAQPHRLRRAAVDRVGGLGDGSRVRRAGRDRLRAPRRLRAERGRLRRGDAAMSDGDGIPEIGVGLLGYAFMGKAHANAYRTIGYMTWPPPLRPRLVSIAGRNEAAVSEAARRYGFERHETDWRATVADPDVQLFDNGGPNNLHAEPTLAAAEAGKHVVCEKPLGRTADESYDLWQRVAASGVVHMCAFNYRFVPAVRLARELIEAGELGELYHFRGRYLQEWGSIDDEVWRFEKAAAG